MFYWVAKQLGGFRSGLLISRAECGELGGKYYTMLYYSMVCYII